MKGPSPSRGETLKTKRLKRTSLLKMKIKNNSNQKKKVDKEKQNFPSKLNVDLNGNKEILLVERRPVKRNVDSSVIRCACHSCLRRSVLQQQHYQSQQQIRNEQLQMMYRYQGSYIGDHRDSLLIKTNKIIKTKPTSCFHQQNMIDLKHFHKRCFPSRNNPLFSQPGCYSMTSSVDSNTSDNVTSQQQQAFVTSQQTINDKDFFNFVNF